MPPQATCIVASQQNIALNVCPLDPCFSGQHTNNKQANQACVFCNSFLRLSGDHTANSTREQQVG
eukprot:m.423442 g.423442  ORF g.423442 m.423442 type:complete len:65 (+) comp20211_c3_seq1:3458-3652(+)